MDLAFFIGVCVGVLVSTGGAIVWGRIRGEEDVDPLWDQVDRDQHAAMEQPGTEAEALEAAADAWREANHPPRGRLDSPYVRAWMLRRALQIRIRQEEQ